LPPAVDWVTAILRATARAVGGMPQRSANVKRRCAPATMVGPPQGSSGSRVSTTRQGSTVKKTAGHTGRISTLAESLALHPFPSLTITSSVTDPDGPEENVMLCVPAPPVIAPFVIDHMYVAPTPASGTEAVCPPELGQTEDGARDHGGGHRVDDGIRHCGRGSAAGHGRGDAVGPRSRHGRGRDHGVLLARREPVWAGPGVGRATDRRGRELQRLPDADRAVVARDRRRRDGVHREGRRDGSESLFEPVGHDDVVASGVAGRRRVDREHRGRRAGDRTAVGYVHCALPPLIGERR
jgi:hypothetical protein